MVRHISRKELKTDEIHDTLAQGVEGVLSHQKAAGLIVGVIVVVALAVGGWKIYTERQTVKASAAFDDAMKIFQARIMKPGDPVEPGEPTYMNPRVKFVDASAKFGDVAKTYPRTRPGELAHYYAALSLERVNQDMEAKKWLEGLTSSSSDEFVALAKNEIAQIDDRSPRPHLLRRSRSAHTTLTRWMCPTPRFVRREAAPATQLLHKPKTATST